jgi:hypothetical protein
LGLDKVVWTAPQAEGAYSLTVEVFPSAPQAGASFAFKSPVYQDLKIMVIAVPGGSGYDFADPLAFYSMLKMKGGFDDLGTRPRGQQPESFGSPKIDTYSEGFGYRFGTSSGVRIPGLMPPSGASGSIGAFSTLVRVDSTQTDGVLERFSSTDGSYSLVIGLDALKPYAEFQIGGVVQRSTAYATISSFPLTLEAIFVPDGTMLDIRWVAEGERLASPSLPLPSAPPDGSAQLGGPESLAGVYDGFGLMVGSAAPSYRLASKRAWKNTLVLAEAFEDAAVPPGSSVKGPISLDFGFLELGPGSSLALPPSFGFASPLVVEADMAGDYGTCSLVFSTVAGDRVFSIGATGEVADASGKRIGALPAADGRLALTLELKGDSLYLRSEGGSSRVVLRLAAKHLVLSLERAAEPSPDTDASVQASPAFFQRVLVRSTSSSSIQK